MVTQQDERENVMLGSVYAWPLEVEGTGRAEGVEKASLSEYHIFQ